MLQLISEHCTKCATGLPEGSFLQTAEKDIRAQDSVGLGVTAWRAVLLADVSWCWYPQHHRDIPFCRVSLGCRPDIPSRPEHLSVSCQHALVLARRGIPTIAMAPPLAPVGDASWCSNRRVLLEAG